MKILLAIPHNGTVVWNMAQSAWKSTNQHEVQIANLPSSLLALGFNNLYAEALNRNEAGDFVELFAMLHGDISPEGPWLDSMVQILLDKAADLVSAVNAIKDGRGLTSSGLGVPGEPWMPLRRFTMRQLQQYPKTFNAADLGCPDQVLLHNTGCWIADLRRPIFHADDENGCLRAFFTINDRIVKKRVEGVRKWVAEVEPEDWFFSRRLHEMRANTYVTREVVTHHYGMSEVDNQQDRGNNTDVDLELCWKAREEEEAASAGK